MSVHVQNNKTITTICVQRIESVSRDDTAFKNHSSLSAMSQPITAFVIKFSYGRSASLVRQKHVWEIKDWRVTGREGAQGGKKENDFMLIGSETSSIYIIKMQIDTLQHCAQTHTHTHTHTHTGCSIFGEDGGVVGIGAVASRTGRENAISSPVLPANDLPHLLQTDVFQQHEDRSHLIGEPAVTQGTSRGAGYTKCAMTHHLK